MSTLKDSPEYGALCDSLDLLEKQGLLRALGALVRALFALLAAIKSGAIQLPSTPAPAPLTPCAEPADVAAVSTDSAARPTGEAAEMRSPCASPPVRRHAAHGNAPMPAEDDVVVSAAPDALAKFLLSPGTKALKGRRAAAEIRCAAPLPPALVRPAAQALKGRGRCSGWVFPNDLVARDIRAHFVAISDRSGEPRCFAVFGSRDRRPLTPGG